MKLIDDDATLDPEDWSEVRRTFHAAVDSCLDQMICVRQRPVWQPAPPAVKARFCERLPAEGESLGDLLEFFEENMQPYATATRTPGSSDGSTGAAARPECSARCSRRL